MIRMKSEISIHETLDLNVTDICHFHCTNKSFYIQIFVYNDDNMFKHFKTIAFRFIKT